MSEMTEPTVEDDTSPQIETGWAEPPSLSDLKQDLQTAKPIHDTQTTKVSTWLDNLHIQGKAKPKVRKGNSAIAPKLIRKQAEWRYAPLSEPFLSTDALFSVKPTTWEDREAAQQNQLLLNYQMTTSIDKVEFIDEYVRTAVDEGTVIIRVGWEFIEEDYEGIFPQFSYQVSPASAPLMLELRKLKAESPSEYETKVTDELKQAYELSLERGVPVAPIKTGMAKETRTRTVKNRPTVEICDYRNVVIDPTCGGKLEKAQFIIYSFESSRAELEKDGKYQNLDKIQAGQGSPLAEADHEVDDADTFKFKDQARQTIVVYEYWGFRDIDGTGMTKPFVASWVGNTMIRLEENPYPDKQLPFVTVQYLPVRKSIYGEPDGALLEDNQRVIGAVTRGIIDTLGKSATGQTGMRKDMLDATNRRKFERGDDYEFNPQVDPRVGVHTHIYPPIPESAQFMLQLQNQESESLTGVKSYSAGVSGASLGDVAAGVRGALDAASKRELGILRRLSNGIIKVGRKIISMNSEFLSATEVIRVTNEEFVTVRRDDLAGNFDLKLSISTAEEDNNKAEQLAFMLQTTGNNMDPELNKMILSDIARLRKMPDLAKKIETFDPKPDPLQQRKLEAEVALAEAEVMKVQAEAQRAMASAQLDAQRASTEGAKAENLQSETDLNSLEFVERENGVTQERDIERMSAQARSQAQLKVIDNNMREKSEDKKHQYKLIEKHLDSNKT